MVAPAIALAGLAGLGISAGSNLYRGISSYDFNKRQSNAYRALDAGYSSYLARHGLRVNPNRNITSGFHAKALSSDLAGRNALASSVGSLGGSFGAGAALSRWL